MSADAGIHRENLASAFAGMTRGLDGAKLRKASKMQRL